MAPEPVPTRIAAIDRPSPPLMKYYVFKALAATVAAPILLVYLYFRYHSMRYRFDMEGIHMTWGIIMRHEIMLNYSRIQDIQLRSNFIERWLGLARIEIQTASGSGSEMTLEGLTDHIAMRDFLYSRMRGARHITGAAHDTESQAGDPLAGVLTAIAEELRAIRQIVEKHGA